jgi:hypothetical protein
MGRSPGFGSTPCDSAPCSDSVSLRLRGLPLKLATRSNSPAHSSIGRPSGIPEPCGSGIALRLIVGTRFQVLFHSPPGVLFTFPSRYLSAIGRQEYLALEGGPPEFPRGSSCPAVLRTAAQEAPPFSPTGLSPSVARRSRAVRLMVRLLTSRPVLRPVRQRPVTPPVQRRRAITHRQFRLFPFRSPLLGESRLISLPQGTEMFQFPCWPSRAYGFSAGWRGITPAGFPHSGTPGSQPARRLPGAIAVDSALHRLLAPGHPPCALSSLKPTTLGVAI